MTIARKNKEALNVADNTKTIITNRVNEIVLMEENSTVNSRDTYGDSFIWGSAINGIWGTAVWGESARTVTILSVVNPNNIFRERFRDTTFRNDTTTSANWAGISGQLTMSAGTVARSTSIAYNDGTVFDATISTELSLGAVTNLVFKLTADGGSNDESVSHNTLHSFTNTGTDLQFEITASADTIITLAKVIYS